MCAVCDLAFALVSAITRSSHDAVLEAHRMASFLKLSEAIEEVVRDGDTAAFEGFTHLIPYAAGHETIRQRRRDLTLVRMTPDLIYDQLIGTGAAKKMVFSWGGNPGVGSLHRFRDAYEQGWPRPLEIEEHSHAAMASAYEAGAAGRCRVPRLSWCRLARVNPASSPSPALHRRGLATVPRSGSTAPSSTRGG
jgi:hypothetical protein